MTDKQKNAVDFVYAKLGVKFNEEDYDNVSEFLSEFLATAKEMKYEENYREFEGDETLWGYDGDAL